MGTLWAAAASRRTNLAVLFRGTSPVSILLKSLVRERGDDWSLACGWNIQYVLKRVACIRYSVAARSLWSEMRQPTRCDKVCCQYLHIGNVEVLEPSDNLGIHHAEAGTLGGIGHAHRSVISLYMQPAGVQLIPMPMSIVIDLPENNGGYDSSSANCTHLHTAIISNHTDLKRGEARDNVRQ